MSERAAAAIYPYQITLQEGTACVWTHICGGTIVTERHTITAAHCLTVFDASSLSIWAGSSQLYGYDGQRYTVDKCINHPDYKFDEHTSDIGIITIHGSFKFIEKVSVSYAFLLQTLFIFA